MSEVGFCISNSEHPGSWQIVWSVGGVDVGDPVPLPVSTVKQLRGRLGELGRLFEGRGAGGDGRRPIVAAAALETVGQELCDACCASVWGEVQPRLAGGSHRLLIQSTVAEALNLPWELLPLGYDQSPLGCDKSWLLYRTPLANLGSAVAAGGGPLRILFLASAPREQDQLDGAADKAAIQPVKVRSRYLLDRTCSDATSRGR